MALKQIFKRGADVVSGLFKDNSATLIKTSSKITGSAAPAVTGGKAIAKETAASFAKGVGSTARIGGKVFAATGIVGVPIVAGTKIYDYLGDVRAKTEEMRQYDQMIKLADKETDVVNKAKQSALDFAAKEKAAGVDSGSLSASGGADGTGGYFPILGNLSDTAASAADKAQANSASTKTIMYGVLALAALGTGLYIYNKKSKGGKK